MIERAKSTFTGFLIGCSAWAIGLVFGLLL